MVMKNEDEGKKNRKKTSTRRWCGGDGMGWMEGKQVSGWMDFRPGRGHHLRCFGGAGSCGKVQPTSGWKCGQAGRQAADHSNNEAAQAALERKSSWSRPEQPDMDSSNQEQPAQQPDSNLAASIGSSQAWWQQLQRAS